MKQLVDIPRNYSLGSYLRSFKLNDLDSASKLLSVISIWKAPFKMGTRADLYDLIVEVASLRTWKTVNKEFKNGVFCNRAVGKNREKLSKKCVGY